MRLSLNTKTLEIEILHNADVEYKPSDDVLDLCRQCKELKEQFQQKKVEIDSIFGEYVKINILPKLQHIADKIQEINQVK